MRGSDATTKVCSRQWLADQPLQLIRAWVTFATCMSGVMHVRGQVSILFV